MTNPIPTTLSGYTVRSIREVTPGTTPAGAMQSLPFKTFTPAGGDVTRTKAGNVSGSGQVPANIATDLVTPSVAASSDLLHSHYNQQWGEVMCADAVAGPAAVTGTNISITSGNKLTLVSGTWPFLVGDYVYVTGPWVSNPVKFISRVTVNSTVNLTLDTAYGTLVAEANPGSISVSYASRFRLGNSLLTGTYEMFHPTALTGSVLTYLSAYGVTAKFAHPGAPDLTWQLMGPNIAAITAALANTTTAAAAQYPMNSNIGFGAKLLTGGGGGLFYSGALYPNVRVQELSVAITRPRKVSGAAGALGPLVVFVDDLFDIKVSLKVCNDHADARALLTDSRNPNTVASLGWAWQAPDGALEYWYFAGLDPSKGTPGQGVAQTGEDIFEFEWMAHADATHTMFERVLLT